MLKMADAIRRLIAPSLRAYLPGSDCLRQTASGFDLRCAFAGEMTAQSENYDSDVAPELVSDGPDGTIE